MRTLALHQHLTVTRRPDVFCFQAYEFESENALVAATAGGHVEAVKAILEAGSDPNRMTRTGNTALRTAIMTGDGDCIAALLERGASVNMETARGTPLVVACARGEPAIVQQLLDAGADLEKETRSATTPLIAAVREDRVSVVKLLLEKGADPERDSRDGMSAVALAEEHGHSEAYSLLMQEVVKRSADNVLEASAGRIKEANEAREVWHKKSLKDLEERLSELRAEREGKVDALRAENDELRKRLGLA